jgi:hypothetical protein
MASLTALMVNGEGFKECGGVGGVINAMLIENWTWYQLVRGYYHSTDIGPRDINGSSIMTYNSYVFLAYMMPKCSGFIRQTCAMLTLNRRVKELWNKLFMDI